MEPESVLSSVQDKIVDHTGYLNSDIVFETPFNGFVFHVLASLVSLSPFVKNHHFVDAELGLDFLS